MKSDAMVGGALLMFHAGEFELPSTLHLTDCVQLAAWDGDVVLRLAPSAHHPVVAIHNASGAALRGVRVVGHAGSVARQHHSAVDIVDGQGVIVEAVDVIGGVSVTGGSRHTLTRMDVSNPFGHGPGGCVYFTKAGDPLALTECHHEISHSEIHDCRGLGDPWPSSLHPPHGANPDRYPNITGNGVLINQVVGARVHNNYIHDVNYHGVYTQSRLHFNFVDPQESPAALNVIELNHVVNWNQCVSDPLCRTKGYLGADGACIYFFSKQWSYGNRVLNNFCHQTDAETWAGKGLYLDGTSTGVELVSGNVLWNVTGNVIDNNNGHDNHYFGNIAIDGYHMGAMTDSNFWADQHGGGAVNFGSSCHNPERPDDSYNMTRHIMQYALSPAWRERFPSILEWLNASSWRGRSCDPFEQHMDCCMFPTGTVVNYTVMVNVGSKEWQGIPDTFCGNTRAFDPPIGCWPDKAHFQVLGQQKLYTQDPGFVDMAAGNFALKPDAQLLKDFPGFPDIPFSKIGPDWRQTASPRQPRPLHARAASVLLV